MNRCDTSFPAYMLAGCATGSSTSTRRRHRSAIPRSTTSPLRAASVRIGDPHAVNVWAGTGFRHAKAAPVAEIIRDLV